MNECVSISKFCKLTNELKAQENLIQCVNFKTKKIKLQATAKQKFITISLNQKGCLEYTVTIGEKRTSHVLELMYGIEGKKESCSGYNTINKYGTFLMELVDALNNNFNVASCSLEDDATIQAEGKYKGVYLSMLYYLKHGMSWYNSLGYLSDNLKFAKKINGFLEKPITEWTKYVKNRNYGGSLRDRVDSTGGSYMNWLFISRSSDDDTTYISKEEKNIFRSAKNRKKF